MRYAILWSISIALEASFLVFFFLLTVTVTFHSWQILSLFLFFLSLFFFNEERTPPRVWYITRDKIITFAKRPGETSLQLFLCLLYNTNWSFKKNHCGTAPHCSTQFPGERLRQKRRGQQCHRELAMKVSHSWPQCFIQIIGQPSRGEQCCREMDVFYFQRFPSIGPRCRAAQCTLQADWVRGHRRESAAVF